MLELLREQRADIFVRQKTMERIKQEEKDPSMQKTHGLNPPSTVEIPQNLNTIEVEVSTVMTGLVSLVSDLNHRR